MAKQPGVMIYFDIAEAVQKLDDAARGILFDAILQYAQLGKIPDRIKDGKSSNTTFAFYMIKPKIDADKKRYSEVVEKRKRAAEASAAKRKAKEDAEFTELAEDTYF